MTKDKEEFSILRELWLPALFGIILIILMVGGYFLTATDVEAATTTSPATTPEVTTSITNKNIAVQTPKDFGKNVIIFLNDLKNGEKEDAYHVTSKAFQEAMPYPKFTQFLADYPILTKFEQLDAGASRIEGKTAFFSVVLRYSKDQFPVQFTLTQEGDDWKILGFVINQTTSSGEDFKDINDMMSLVDIAKRFLSDIRDGHLDQVYNKQTTADFKTKTTAEEFESFINEKKIFKALADFKVLNGHIEGKKGFIKGALTQGDTVVPIDFTLRQENDGWKIDGLFLPPSTYASQTTTPAPTTTNPTPPQAEVKKP